MVKQLSKDDLYKLSDWASWECENLVNNLDKLGLAVVDKKELETNNLFCSLCEDDGK